MVSFPSGDPVADAREIGCQGNRMGSPFSREMSSGPMAFPRVQDGVQHPDVESRISGPPSLQLPESRVDLS